FIAHYRAVKTRFLSHADRANATSPYPVSHCDLCAWQERCTTQLDEADHLSRVAGMRRGQVDRLGAAGIATLEQLAARDQDDRPSRIAAPTWRKLSTQARLQEEQRRAIAADEPAPYKFLILPPDTETTAARGLGALPPRSAGDVFFDMEGDPFATDGDRWFGAASGLEYLFGVHTIDGGFTDFWGCDRSGAPTPRHFAAERRAFEAFVDYVVRRRAAHPDLHIYHYGSYEQTAMKTLMERHRTREDDIHALLREGCFVDLYRIVKQSVMIGQPRYGIKYLEPFYEKRARTGVKKGDDSIVAFESWLTSRAQGAPDDAILADIEQYNRFDCESTLHLLDWLWALRDANPNAVVQPPDVADEEPSKRSIDARTRRQQREAELHATRARLLANLPVELEPGEAARLPEPQRAAWLFSEMLLFYDRESKPEWWAYHDACDTFVDTPADLVDAHSSVLAGLTPLGEREDGATLFSYPAQQHRIKAGDSYHDPATRRACGKVVDLDDQTQRIAIALRQGVPVPSALIEAPTSLGDALEASLLRSAGALLGGRGAAAPRNPLYDVLLKRAPRLTDRPSGAIVQPDNPNAQSLLALVRALDSSYLFVQGPPGAGKTYVAAATILSLLTQGKRVGIAAPTHKAAHNLLDRIADMAIERGVSFRGMHRAASKKDAYVPKDGAGDFVATLAKAPTFENDYQLYSGTAWLYASEKAAGALDYLFVDEAGQMALPTFAAMAPAAANIVLLGDPAQLSQVSHASHPGDVGLSVLQYLLGDAPTIAPERGMFLTTSWRMHRDICRFVSEISYRGRLHEHPNCNRQTIFSPGLVGSGLRYLPVDHEGNRNRSPEEAGRIADEIATLLDGELVDQDGGRRAIAPEDIIVVAPYNAQRQEIERAIAQRVGRNVEVGTVDKFQGREAYVVFYSMATSSGEDMPRNADFLFARNRMNVAVSRARALAVLVASPRLLEAATPSVDAMRLLNGLDRFLELAR
ncbi:MAG TPA: TM0106 family RecB-like putative nuclease, partial [Candidatus Baltobacteraceae bacterium]